MNLTEWNGIIDRQFVAISFCRGFFHKQIAFQTEHWLRACDLHFADSHLPFLFCSRHRIQQLDIRHAGLIRSLHLHGTNPMVERKARCLWKGHQWNERGQENGGLRNGHGKTQGHRCDQWLRNSLNHGRDKTKQQSKSSQWRQWSSCWVNSNIVSIWHRDFFRLFYRLYRMRWSIVLEYRHASEALSITREPIPLGPGFSIVASEQTLQRLVLWEFSFYSPWEYLCLSAIASK